MTINSTGQQRRRLGATGFAVSRLGIGDLADRSLSLKECVLIARRAMDAGLNLIDTAPGYESGFSEEIVGTAVMEHADRDSVFVIDKIDHLEQPVSPQVQESLQRLRLEYADAFVLHGISSLDHWSTASAPGGSMHQLSDEIKKGWVRFKGISSHNPEVLAAAIESGLCDIIMFAIGPYCNPRYVQEILPLARRHNIATVCFKTFGAGKLIADTSGYGQPLNPALLPPVSVKDKSRTRPLTDTAGPHLPHLTVAECLHYTLSRDPDVALLGLSTPAEQDAAFQAARDYHSPLSETELQILEQRAAEAVAEKGPCWWNPETLQPA